MAFLRASSFDACKCHLASDNRINISPNCTFVIDYFSLQLCICSIWWHFPSCWYGAETFQSLWYNFQGEYALHFLTNQVRGIAVKQGIKIAILNQGDVKLLLMCYGTRPLWLLAPPPAGYLVSTLPPRTPSCSSESSCFCPCSPYAPALTALVHWTVFSAEDEWGHEASFFTLAKSPAVSMLWGALGPGGSVHQSAVPQRSSHSGGDCAYPLRYRSREGTDSGKNRAWQGALLLPSAGCSFCVSISQSYLSTCCIGSFFLWVSSNPPSSCPTCQHLLAQNTVHPPPYALRSALPPQSF